jgi:hypothetical protein
MVTPNRVFLAGLLAVIGWPLASPPQPDEAALFPAWEQTLSGSFLQLAVSPDGRCVAAVTERQPTPIEAKRQPSEPERRVVVFDAAGQPLWATAVPPQVSHVLAFALAPGCAWAALSEYPPNGWKAGEVPPTTLLLLDENGTRQAVPIAGIVESIAISHASDALALGLTSRKGDPNICIVTPAGQVVASAGDDITYRAPLLTFSDDDRHVIVTGFFGVGVLDRHGTAVWGIVEPPAERRLASEVRRRPAVLWRGIDPSGDLKWFAAHYAPMHGFQGGEVALLAADGHLVWQRTNLWEPDAVIAPDGRYVVVQGAPMRGEDREPDSPDVVYSIVDRQGKTLAERRIPRALLWFVTGDGQTIVFSERSATEPFNTDLVVRDAALNVKSRVSLGRSLSGKAWHRDSGLVVVVTSGSLLRAYRIR